MSIPVERSTGSRRTWRSWAMAAAFGVILGVPVMFGGGVPDQSWLLVTGAVAIAVCLGVWRAEFVYTPRVLLWLASGVILSAVPLLYLVPLPLSLVTSMSPGGIGLAEPWLVDAGVDWRPLSWWPEQTWRAFARGLVLLVIVAVGASVGASFRKLQLVGRGLVLVAAGASLVALLQRAGVSVPIGLWAGFGNANHGGHFVAAVLPLAIALTILAQRRMTQGAMGLSVVLLFLGGLASGSRAAWVLVVVGPLLLVAWVALTPRWRLGVAAFAFLLLAGGRDWIAARVGVWLEPERIADGLSGRGEVWSDATRLVGLAWPFGTGPGGFQEGYRLVKSTPVFGLATHAHHDFVQLFAEFGVLAAPILAWVFLPVGALMARRSTSRHGQWLSAALGASGVVLMVASLVDFPAHIGALQIFGGFVLGASVAQGLPGIVDTAISTRWARLLVAINMGALLTVAVAVQLVAPWSYPTPVDGAQWRARLVARPLHHAAMMQLAKESQAAGDVDGADLWVRRVNSVYPSWPYGWLARARLARASGRTDDAAAAWNALVHLHGPDSVVHEPWLDEAFRDVDDPAVWALQVLGADSPLWCRVAAKVSVSATRQDGEPILVLASAFQPSCTSYYAWRLVHWGAPREALSLVGEATGSCDAARTRAVALDRVGTPEEALSAWTRAVPLCSGDRVVRLSTALARARTGDQRAVSSLSTFAEESQSIGEWRMVVSGARYVGDVRAERQALEWLESRGALNGVERSALVRLRAGR